MRKQLLLEEFDKYSKYCAKKNKKLEHLVVGFSKDEEKICLKIQNCKMQKWFNEREELLNTLYGVKRMKKLNAYIEEWHEDTEKICKLFMEQENRKKTLTEKLFKKRQKGNSYTKEQDKIDLWKMNILSITIKIESKFKMMKNRLNAMSEEMVEEKSRR
ncbi:MAG: hypothetical protein U9O24_09880 [Campylobacterota bacterium]|nr:hypothetical protein [Campylobacterota bacterium]